MKRKIKAQKEQVESVIVKEEVNMLRSFLSQKGYTAIKQSLDKMLSSNTKEREQGLNEIMLLGLSIIKDVSTKEIIVKHTDIDGQQNKVILKISKPNLVYFLEDKSVCQIEWDIEE